MNLKSQLTPEVNKLFAPPNDNENNVSKILSNMPSAIEKIYVCSVCGKYFTSEAQMKMHNFMHSRPRNIRFISKADIPKLNCGKYKMLLPIPDKQPSTVFTESKIKKERNKGLSAGNFDDLEPTKELNYSYSINKKLLPVTVTHPTCTHMERKSESEAEIILGTSFKVADKAKDGCGSGVKYKMAFLNPDNELTSGHLTAQNEKENKNENINVLTTICNETDTAKERYQALKLVVNPNIAVIVHTFQNGSKEISADEKYTNGCLPPETHEVDETASKYRYQCMKCAFYICRICHKSYKGKAAFRTHTNMHIGLAHYLCEECGVGFQGMRQFNRHKIVEHKGLDVKASCRKNYRQCDVCFKYFSSYLEYEQHYFSHLNDVRYSCNICSLEFPSEKVLINHKFAQHNTGDNSFSDISKEEENINDADKFQAHLESHESSPLKDFLCEVCKETFKTDDELQMHYLQHVNEHYILHDVISIYSCDSCQQKFLSEEELNSHLCSEMCLDNCSSVTTPQCSSTEPVANFPVKISNTNVEENSASASEYVSRIIYDQTSKNTKMPDDFENCDNDCSVSKMNNITTTVCNSNLSSLKEETLHSISGCISENVDSDILLNIDPTLSEISDCMDEQSVYLVSVNSEHLSCAESPHNAKDEVIKLSNVNNQGCIEEEDISCIIESNNISADRNKNSQTSDIFAVTGTQESSALRIFYPNDSHNCGRENTRNSTDSSDLNEECETHVCHICHETCTSLNKLYKHMQEVHTGFDCKFCKKSFCNQSLLKSHICIRKQFKCNICGKGFVRKYSLEYHISLHTGTRPFTCNLCNKSFLREFQLRNHLVSHEGFKCEFCAKVYKSQVSYKYHFMSCHTGQADLLKTHKCSICGETFRLSNHLTRHSIGHFKRNSQNLQCRICSMFFKSALSLSKHMVVHSVQQ